MALSYTDSVARWKRDYKLLGLPEDATIKDILVNSLSDFISIMDEPVISATLAVTTGTLTYDIPDTIDKIQDIRDGDGTSVVYSEDETAGQVTFQDAVTTGDYTVYGTPDEVRTNIETIIAAVPEKLEDIWWNFVEAYSYKWANEDSWANLLSVAENQALKRRRRRNRRLDNLNISMKNIDVRGYNINDSANREGFDVQIDGLFKNDL